MLFCAHNTYKLILSWKMKIQSYFKRKRNISPGKWTLWHTELLYVFWNICFSKLNMGSSFALIFFFSLLLAIMSVFDTYSEQSLRFCFTICLLLKAKWASLFSQYFEGLGINLNSNCKDDRRNLSLTKTRGIKTLNQHLWLQELHWIGITKEFSFTGENSKSVLAASLVTAEDLPMFFGW